MRILSLKKLLVKFLKNMVKVVCLGNEFVSGDSLAIEVGRTLEKDGFDVVYVKDSFSLMSFLSEEEDFVILDVVEGLDEVSWIGVEDLRVDSIDSAHDFDAGYVLGLIGEGVRILGLPRSGDAGEILEKVRELIVDKI